MNYRALFESAMEFDAYLSHIRERAEEADPNSTALERYYPLNLQRINRLIKTSGTGSLPEPKSPIRVLIITEGWCGDAAQSIPVWESWTESLNIHSRYVLRDENPELMEQHLTNGSKSIPVFVFLDDGFKVFDAWGPRPKALQEMVMDYKRQREPKQPYAEFSKEVQLWYARNKQEEMAREWNAILKNKA